MEQTYLHFPETAKAASQAYVEKLVKNSDNIKPPTVKKTFVTLALTPKKRKKGKKRDNKAAEAAKLSRYVLCLTSSLKSSRIASV